jgi:hypothetical protein
MDIVGTRCTRRKGQDKNCNAARTGRSEPWTRHCIQQAHYVPKAADSNEKQSLPHAPKWPHPGKSEVQSSRKRITACELAAGAIGTGFPVAVPDYIQADWFIASPKSRHCDEIGQPQRGRKRIGEGVRWAIHQAVIVQKTSRVILADVVLAQVLWGEPIRSTKGVRSPCWRSLTLFQNSLDPLEEIVGVPGAYAVPPLVQPTAGP